MFSDSDIDAVLDQIDAGTDAIPSLIMEEPSGSSGAPVAIPPPLLGLPHEALTGVDDAAFLARVVLRRAGALRRAA
jgi:hypothetical protein